MNYYSLPLIIAFNASTWLNIMKCIRFVDTTLAICKQLGQKTFKKFYRQRQYAVIMIGKTSVTQLTSRIGSQFWGNLDANNEPQQTRSRRFFHDSSRCDISSMQWDSVAIIPVVVALNVYASPLKSIACAPCCCSMLTTCTHKLQHKNLITNVIILTDNKFKNIQ